MSAHPFASDASSDASNDVTQGAGHAEYAEYAEQAEHVGHAGYVVLLFFVCFAFSYLDRQVVSILVQPIKASLSLSDTQIGLMQGISFTMCYATAGVFVARLVDRANRVRLIAACVLIWALSTVLCGFATNFTELLLARAGTAVAEAALSPAALSIFSDMFAPRKVTRASSVFMLGPYIGGGVALFGGGLLLSATSAPSGSAWLAHWGLAPWQAVFVAVGLPGLVLAALVAVTVREPARRGLAQVMEPTTGPVVDALPSMRDVLRELFVRNRFCAPYFAAYVALITLFYAHAAWFPTLLMRQYHLSAPSVGEMAAPAYMIGGILGVITAGLLAAKATDRGALRRVLAISSAAAALLIPMAILMPLLPDSRIAVTLYGACAFAASIAMALAPVPLQIALPNRMRGRAIALLVFMTNAISGGVGPLAVGWLNERMGQTPTSLGTALALVGGLAAVLSAVCYLLATRRVARPAVGAVDISPHPQA